LHGDHALLKEQAAGSSVDTVNSRVQIVAVDAGALGLAAALAVLLIVASVVFWVVSARAASGALGPNRWAGIRTRSTLASPAAWVAAHRAAKPGLQTAAVILGATGVAVGALGWTTDLLPLILLVGVALLSGALIRAVIFGTRAAKTVNQHSYP
jgi:hypothetical protein